jgi:hypothetical protein
MPQDDTISHQTHGERALWAAVVLQAIHDLDDDPRSLIYSDAVAFFTGTSEWRRSRTDIADSIGVHADDLERCGRRLIDAHKTPGVVMVQVVAPLAAPVVAPIPVVVPVPVKPLRRIKTTKDRNWWISQFLATEAS